MLNPKSLNLNEILAYCAEALTAGWDDIEVQETSDTVDTILFKRNGDTLHTVVVTYQDDTQEKVLGVSRS